MIATLCKRPKYSGVDSIERDAVDKINHGSNDSYTVPIPREEILAQLACILKSPHFVQSARLSRFLSYAVERTAAGKPQDLKEYSIGVEVYDRKPPYHPSDDSIVRTEARRLRTKLKHYYEGEGKADPIQFYFRLGSYVPVFRAIETSIPDAQLTPSDESRQRQAAGVLFVVFPFADLSGTTLTSSFAHGLTDEIIHWVMRAQGCRVIGYSTLQQLVVREKLDAAAIAKDLGAQVALEGTVREDGGRIRVTCTFVSLPGLERWSERFEGTAAPHMFFELEEQIATALVGRFAPQSSAIKRRRRDVTPEEVAYYPELLAGEALLDRGDPLSIQHALEQFRRIEKEQPMCARASCGIAQSYYWLAMLGAPIDASWRTDSLRVADRALNIDAEMIEAHAARGCALMLSCDWRAADVSFKNCVQLGSYPPAHRLYGDLLTSRGRFDEAFQVLEHAQSIDPFSSRQKVSYLRYFYFSRRYDDALTYRAAAAKYGPISSEALVFEGLAYLGLGRTRDAAAVAAALYRRSSGALPILTEACGIFASSGERRRASALCESYRLLDAATPITATRKALLAIALEDFVRAEAYFEEAFYIREPDVCWLGVDPRCDRVAGLGYFSALLRDIPKFQQNVPALSQ